MSTLWRRPGLPRAGFLVACLLVLASLTFWAPTFWISITVQALIFAIFAMSLDLLLGYAGMASFGHAAFFGAGAYACAYFALHRSADLLPVLAVAIGVATLLAVPIGALSLRTHGIYFLMITLAFGQMLWGYAYQSPRNFLGGSDGLIGVPRPELHWLSSLDTALWGLAGSAPRLPALGDFYNLVLLMAVLVFVFLSALVASPLGRSLEGIRENEHRMQALGYRTYGHRLAAFVVAGGLAGLAGCLSALFNGYANASQLYWTNSGLVLIAVIVGGTRSLIGPALGAFLVLIVQDSLSSLSDRWPLLLGSIFIAFVLFVPGGLAGAGRMVTRR